MGNKRKVAKTFEPKKLPVILLMPNADFNPDDADVITVTDTVIYARMLDGVQDALDCGRAGVERHTQKEK